MKNEITTKTQRVCLVFHLSSLRAFVVHPCFPLCLCGPSLLSSCFCGSSLLFLPAFVLHFFSGPLPFNFTFFLPLRQHALFAVRLCFPRVVLSFAIFHAFSVLYGLSLPSLGQLPTETKKTSRFWRDVSDQLQKGLYLAPKTASFAAFATRNLTTVLAGI